MFFMKPSFRSISWLTRFKRQICEKAFTTSIFISIASVILNIRRKRGIWELAFFKAAGPPVQEAIPMRRMFSIFSSRVSKGNSSSLLMEYTMSLQKLSSANTSWIVIFSPLDTNESENWRTFSMPEWRCLRKPSISTFTSNFNLVKTCFDPVMTRSVLLNFVCIEIELATFENWWVFQACAPALCVSGHGYSPVGMGENHMTNTILVKETTNETNERRNVWNSMKIYNWYRKAERDYFEANGDVVTKEW